MEKWIKEIYSEAILAEVLGRYGVQINAVTELDGFESFIYEYEKDGQDYILRVTHCARRTADMIGGEIDWLNYLVDGGVPAARVVSSEKGRLVEVLDAPDTGEADDAYFLAVAFEKAPGTYPSEADWEGGLPDQLGRIMGRMHALTQRYRPGEPRIRRPSWHDEVAGIAEKYLPPSDKIIVDKFNHLLAYLQELPQDRASYGLVHTDVHGGNFYVHEGQITLFDFDDCQYAWFVYDISMALFYAISHDCMGEEDVAWARRFFTEFMGGYYQENVLDPAWLRQIPYFLKLREMDLYIIIHRSFDLDDLDPWCTSFMDRRKYKIEHDIPYVDLDFVQLTEVF
ncbi:MAG TPA: hypothetical protein ENN19_07710 [Chloroflexi bacterium]|nr:hypothetical protein [Chloroflexota bacterium]